MDDAPATLRHRPPCARGSMVTISDVESMLWERERDAWTGGPEYYRRNLAGDVLMVFPGMALGRLGGQK